MTKRIPKSDVSTGTPAQFTLRWDEKNWHTGREIQRERDYHSEELAQLALKIGKEQRSKFDCILLVLKPCPVSEEEEARKYRDSGASWDPRAGIWKYSANY